MRITLDLPPELEDKLSLAATQLNISLPDYILRVLGSQSVHQNSPQTGAELIRFWERNGVINSRPDISDSQDYAHELRHQAETREQA